MTFFHDCPEHHGCHGTPLYVIRTPQLSWHTPVCDKAAVVTRWKKTGSVYPHLILFKELWCISQNGKETFFSRPSTWALGPFWSPLQWVPEAPSPLVKWPVHYDDLSPPSSVKLRMCGATTPLSHTPSEWAEGKLLSLLLHLILRTILLTETERSKWKHLKCFTGQFSAERSIMAEYF